MIDLKKFFGEGLKNTVLLKNNAGLSHSGPFILADNSTLLDRWHIGDFVSAEYTISVDYDSKNREIVKCLVVAGIDDAALKVYSRCSTNIDIVTIEALVNNSYVDVILNPTNKRFKTAKVISTAVYFESQNSINTR